MRRAAALLLLAAGARAQPAETAAEEEQAQKALADYLADELQAGRWRCELDEDALGTRLIEIFRHARTSIEESGANTL